ncbi:hypothetical protein BV20DRAFT_949919 [Pilatotrama ljubarskyi]|nr:hypothetical protein BV20DRAFT_949919 [Pilatotrama ljubarskyi]
MATLGGLYVHHDTGAPAGQDQYTTLVVIHGYVWHGGIFAKLIPLADTYGVRIILLNRREYPGAVPYTAEERALIPSVPSKPRTDKHEIRSATEMLETFMRDRARELYDALQGLVQERNLPPVHPTSLAGGMVLVGWSMGATWMTALLSHVAEFPMGAVNLRDYVRRVALWDPPSSLLGYPHPEQDPYNPFFDTSLTYEERGLVFTNWITSYFSHGATLETFERHTPLRSPPSTITVMGKEELEATVHIPPGVPGGSDWALLHGCISLGVYGTLRRGALFFSLRSGVDETEIAGDEWRAVEVRYVWGENSIWEAPYAAQMLHQEVGEAKRNGDAVRKITTFRVRGANHFGQWDQPERTLQGFLADAEDCDA